MTRSSAFSSRQLACVEALAAVLVPPGHGMPGAAETRTAHELSRRAAAWRPAVRGRVKLLVTAFELSPLLSRRMRTFSRLSTAEQERWIARCMRGRVPVLRMLVLGLKQFVLLAWAAIPEVEEAFGYDYRCWRDDEPHGRSSAAQPGVPAEIEPAPADLVRPGPAIHSGAIPVRLLERTDFHREPRGRVEPLQWPEIGDGAVVTADVAIVGSGAGGSVAAAELAEAGLDVVVLEEGGNYSSETDFGDAVFDRFQRLYRDNGTTLAWGRPPIPLPLGRAVGGTTVVNSGTCFRAPGRVLERWESEFGVTGAHEAALGETYAGIEDFLDVRPVPWELLGPNGMAAHRGATELGLSGGPLLRNIAECHGCGQCVFGCPTDAKQAMHVSYLPRAQKAGARILARTRVERIEVEHGRAVGLSATVLDESDRSRGRIKVQARHVIVAAGAVYTPALLESSRIPDPSGQTGRNLSLHPATAVSGVMPDGPAHWKGTLQSYYIDEYFDTHDLMFEATSAVPGVAAGSLPGTGAAAVRDLAEFSRLATLGFYVSDTSRGRVKKLPGGEVLPLYKVNALDARRMSLGIAIAAEVLLAAGASRVYPAVQGMETISSAREVAELKERSVRPERLRLSAFHPMGTARMGADPEAAVVDAFGRHHSVENLWVADASTFPSCVGVNPQLTIMAFAARTARRLVETG